MGLCASSSAPPAASAGIDTSDVRLDETPAPKKRPSGRRRSLQRQSSEKIVKARITEAKQHRRDRVMFDDRRGDIEIDLSSLVETYVVPGSRPHLRSPLTHTSFCTHPHNESGEKGCAHPAIRIQKRRPRPRVKPNIIAPTSPVPLFIRPIRHMVMTGTFTESHPPLDHSGQNHVSPPALFRTCTVSPHGTTGLPSRFIAFAANLLYPSPSPP